MRILRHIVGGGTALACTAVIALVAADRLEHGRPAPRPRPALAEPSATGSLPVPAAPAGDPRADPRAKAGARREAAIPSGFDTERLNALMRGDPILPGRR